MSLPLSLYVAARAEQPFCCFFSFFFWPPSTPNPAFSFLFFPPKSLIQFRFDRSPVSVRNSSGVASPAQRRRKQRKVSFNPPRLTLDKGTLDGLKRKGERAIRNGGQVRQDIVFFLSHCGSSVSLADKTRNYHGHWMISSQWIIAGVGDSWEYETVELLLGVDKKKKFACRSTSLAVLQWSRVPSLSLPDPPPRRVCTSAITGVGAPLQFTCTDCTYNTGHKHCKAVICASYGIPAPAFCP